METQTPKYKRIAIKIGSNVLASKDGQLDEAHIDKLVGQIASIKKQGVEIILISSGAVAAGKKVISPSNKKDPVSNRQLWSAVGQVKLMNLYHDLFKSNNLTVAQVLTTKQNFRDRDHFQNMRNCIHTLIENDVIPIVNENDTISITELMFTDNDELSGLVASTMHCEALFILTNVDGIYNGHPNEEGSTLIEEIKANDKTIDQFIRATKSGFGRGGMKTKSSIAQKIAKQGIDVHIANGCAENILIDLAGKQSIKHTHIIPANKKESSLKKWLSYSDSFAIGSVWINNGAKEALLAERATSLLTIGITRVAGSFKKGDIVQIFDENNASVALGISKYSAEDTNKLKGEKAKHPFIHYDYLYIQE